LAGYSLDKQQPPKKGLKSKKQLFGKVVAIIRWRTHFGSDVYVSHLFKANNIKAHGESLTPWLM
jgi:hypothetical protein